MRECYRTPAGKQERQAQVEPLRREVRDTLVGSEASPSSGSNGSNGTAASGSNGTVPAAVYTDTDISIVLKVGRTRMLSELTVVLVVSTCAIPYHPSQPYRSLYGSFKRVHDKDQLQTHSAWSRAS